MLRKQLVGEIADRLRYNNECVSPRPDPVQLLCYPQSRGRMRMSSVVLDDDDRIGSLRIDPVLRYQLFADLRLERCEFEIAGLVVFDHEIDRGVAEITNAVE